MSQAATASTLCERCSLLSFDDLAVGGRETVDEDGFPRLSFEDAETEVRPKWLEEEEDSLKEPDCELVRLAWHVDDILPDMPSLHHSSDSGCAFCSAVTLKLKEEIATQAKYYHVQDGPLTLNAFLSLVEGDIEGIVVETLFKSDQDWEQDIQIYFPIEATLSRSSL